MVENLAMTRNFKNTKFNSEGILSRQHVLGIRTEDDTIKARTGCRSLAYL